MTTAEGTPTVVLVHGAFADASSWLPVITELHAAGISAVAPANPLRSLSGDSAYLASFVGQIDGPVLLVGHSYGGAVITNAAAQADNVVGLVFVAAFIPDVGESILEINAGYPDPPLNAALAIKTYPIDGAAEPGVELSIAPESYPDVFAADVPKAVTVPAAYAQRPVSATCFGEKTEHAAWKELPSWAVVATADHAIQPDAERTMAKRAGAHMVELDGSHAVALSQPLAVAELIRTAAFSDLVKTK